MSRYGIVSNTLPPPFLREPRDLFDLAAQASRILDQNFGDGLSKYDLLPAQNFHGINLRPRLYADRRSCGASEIKISDDGTKFQVMLDANQFKPKELSVKTVDNTVVVHGKHEERSDNHGFISREFTRRYMLPAEVKAETVTAQLSDNGILTIEVPKPALEAPEKNERMVPIVRLPVRASFPQQAPEAFPLEDPEAFPLEDPEAFPLETTYAFPLETTYAFAEPIRST